MSNSKPINIAAGITRQISESIIQYVVKSLSISYQKTLEYRALSLSTTLTTVVAAFYTACSATTTGAVSSAVKWFVPVSALFSFGTQLKEFVSAISPDAVFGLDELCECVNLLVETYFSQYFGETEPTVKPNTLDYTSIIKKVVSALVLLITVGLSRYSASPREVLTWMSISEKTFSNTEKITDWVTQTVEETLNMDLSGNAAIRSEFSKLLKTAEELSTTPAAQFVQKPLLRSELNRCMEKILDLQSRKLSTDQYKTYSSVKQYLNTAYTKLLEMETTLNSILDDVHRPACVAYLLNGTPGLGKSELVKYVNARVAKVMGYSKKQYDLAKGSSDRFHQIYAYEETGILNEFGGMRDNREQVSEINSILSSDPVTLEGAHLEFKYQQCKLKLVGLTANRDTFDFKDVMIEHANIALMSRIQRYRVEDPLYTTRRGLNEHRKSDFSHLKIFEVKPRKDNPEKISECWDTVEREVSVQHLIDTMILHCCIEERRFNQRILDSTDDNKACVVPGLTARMAELQKILDDRILTPNARSNFFVVRLQGDIGLGKTTTANQTALILSDYFKYPIIRADNPTVFDDVYDKSVVAIVDDISIHQHQEKYLNWINNMAENSVVIITTNHVIKRRPMPVYTSYGLKGVASSLLEDVQTAKTLKEKFWAGLGGLKRVLYNDTPRVYDCVSQKFTDFTLHPGLYRRVGLTGPVWTTQGVLNVGNHSACVTYTDEGIDIDGTAACGIDVSSYLIDKFITFLRQPQKITVIDSTPPDIPLHVTVEIRDLEAFKRASKTASGYYSMTVDPNNEAGIIKIANPELMSNLMTNTKVSHWVLPNIQDGANFVDVVMPLLYRLRKLDDTVNISISYQDEVYTYTDSLLYTQTPTISSRITLNNGLLYYNQQLMTPEAIVKLYCYPEVTLMDGICSTLTGSQVIELINHVKAHLGDSPYEIYTKAINQELQLISQREFKRKFHPLVRWISENSTGLKIATGLTAALVGMIAIYKTYKMFTSDEKKVKEKKFTKKLAKALAELDPNTMDVDYTHSKIQQQILKKKESGRSLEPTIADLMATITTEGDVLAGCNKFVSEHSLVAEGLTANTFDSISSAERYLSAQESQKHVSKAAARRAKEATMSDNWRVPVPSNQPIRPNALPPEARHNSTSDFVKTFSQKLSRAVCRVSSEGQSCYGLLYGGSKLVTVNHNMSPSVIISWSPNSTEPVKRFQAKLIRSNLDRDLAVFEIIDKQFQPMPSLATYFPCVADQPRWTATGIFVRPFEPIELHSGIATYSGHYRIRGDVKWDAEANYDPIDLITYSHMSFDNSFDIFQPGDCGLPLLVKDKKGVRIVGIHNAKHGNEAYFSPLFREELSSDRVVPNTANLLVKSTVPRFSENYSVPNWNEYLHDIVDADRWTPYPEIDVLGYCKTAVIYSNPKHSKRLYYDDSFEEPVETWPSPVLNSDLTQEARDFLPKTNQGKPCPMLAQVLKIFNRKEFKPDMEALTMAKYIQLEKYQSSYPELRRLRKHEAVNGIFGEGIDRVRFKTSAGPYLKLKYGVTNKESLFYNANADKPDKPPVYCFNDTPAAASVSSDYDLITSLFETGQPVLAVVKDNPKVELLPILDVMEEGKVRIFQEIDLALNLVIRSYIGDFMSKQHQFHLDDNVKIGLNPYYDLNYAIARIPKHMDFFSTDISRMDKNLSPFFINWYCQLLDELTGKKHTFAFKALATTLARRLHVQRGILYVVEGGNPSGIVGTTSINCVAIEFMLIYSYVRQCNRISRADLVNFSDYSHLFRSLDYGDDKLVYYTPGFGYSFETFQQDVSDCGLNCKNEDPSPRPEGYCGTFCSRMIYKDEEHCMYVAALKKESITQGLWWIDPRKVDLLVDQFSLLLFEASLHDEEFYVNVAKIARFQLRRFGVPTNLLRVPEFNQQRRHLKLFYQGQVDCHMLTGIRAVLDSDETTKLPTKVIELQRSKMSENWINKYNEYCAKNKLPTNPVEEASRDSISLEWHFSVIDEGYAGSGDGLQKTVAKNKAYQGLYESRFGNRPQPQTETSKLGTHKHQIKYVVTCTDSGKDQKVDIMYDDRLLTDFITNIKPDVVSQRVGEYFHSHTFASSLEEYIKTGTMPILDFIKKSISLQYGLALKTSKTCRADICLFDGCGAFDDGTVEVVDNVRLLNSHGKRALLSMSAQESLSLSQYSSLLEQMNLAHTITYGGVWCKFSK